MVDKTFLTSASVLFDAIYVPGGAESVETLKMQGDAVHFINEAFKHCKPIVAIAEGVELLKTSDIKGLKRSHRSATTS
jgi:catalase